MSLTPEEQKNTRKKAMHLLEVMDRTEKGLAQKLSENGFSGEAIEDALAYVRSYGYINDQRYAENYISSRLGTKSRQKLFLELRQKGISEETITAAWEEAAQVEAPDERSQIRAILEKKYPDLLESPEISEKDRRRLYGYLLRRGYSVSDIRHVLSEVKNICLT